MDVELIFWMSLFVGGYSLAVGLLLRIVFSKKEKNEASNAGGEGG